MWRRLFPLWTVLVAVATSVSISGRFAEYRQVFTTVASLEDRCELHVLTLAGFGGPTTLGFMLDDPEFLIRTKDSLTRAAARRGGMR